jgi:signal transduction histidine kinase
VIQECLNNAIKHAQPKLIRVDLNFISDHLEVLITDNGIGFDTTIESYGSGVHNLKSRMNAIGGKIEIDSNLGKGTQIKLLLPN